MRFRSISIKTLIIIILSICVIASAVLFTLFTYKGFLRQIEENIRDTYEYALNSAGANLEYAFDDMHKVAAKLTCTGSLNERVKDMILTDDSTSYSEIHSSLVKALVLEDSASNVIGRIDFFYPDHGSYSFLSSDSSNPYATKFDTVLMRKDPLTVFNVPRISTHNGSYVLSLTRFVSASDYGDYYLYIESDPFFLDFLFAPVIEHAGEGTSVCMVDCIGNIVYSTAPERTPIGSNFSIESLEQNGLICIPYKSNQWQIFLIVRAAEYHRPTKLLIRQYILEIIIFFTIYLVLALILYRAAYEPLDAFINELSDNDASGLFRNSIQKSKEYSLFSRKIEEMRTQICQLLTQAAIDSMQKAQLENELLRSRINPHFLHNCLNRINVISSDCGQTALADTVNALNHLMEYNLGRSKISTIKDEISAFEDYIILSQGISYFEYEARIDISPALLSFGIPRFILQPLAENSIKHSKNSNDLKITLHIFQENDKLVIEIIDNGLGIDLDRLTELNSQLNSSSQNLGIGLSHVSEALRFGFADNASFSMHSRKEGGTTARIEISIR